MATAKQLINAALYVVEIVKDLDRYQEDSVLDEGVREFERLYSEWVSTDEIMQDEKPRHVLLPEDLQPIEMTPIDPTPEDHMRADIAALQRDVKLIKDTLTGAGYIIHVDQEPPF